MSKETLSRLALLYRNEMLNKINYDTLINNFS